MNTQSDLFTFLLEVFIQIVQPASAIWLLAWLIYGTLTGRIKFGWQHDEAIKRGDEWKAMALRSDAVMRQSDEVLAASTKALEESHRRRLARLDQQQQTDIERYHDALVKRVEDDFRNRRVDAYGSIHTLMRERKRVTRTVTTRTETTVEETTTERARGVGSAPPTRPHLQAEYRAALGYYMGRVPKGSSAWYELKALLQHDAPRQPLPSNTEHLMDHYAGDLAEAYRRRTVAPPPPCAHCGRTLAFEARFCDRCRMPVGTTAQTGQTVRLPQSAQTTYLGDEACTDS